jgi:uncharacterized metal-binding protein
MKNTQTLIMACCGAANVGQLSNQIAFELVKEGYGSAFCLAGVGAHRRGFVRSAIENDTILIDGCSIGCGKLIFEQAGVPLKKYFVLTDLGIEKSVRAEIRPEELEMARKAVLDLCDQHLPLLPPFKTTSSCCG